VKTPTSPGSTQEIIAEAVAAELATPAPPEQAAQIALPLGADKPANPEKYPSHRPSGATPRAHNPDLRVNVSLKGVIPVGQFGNVQPELGVVSLDPYGDVEAQMQVSLAAGRIAFVRIDDVIRELVDDKLNSEQVAGAPLSERMTKVEEFLEKAKVNINTLAAMVRRAAPPETSEA